MLEPEGVIARLMSGMRAAVVATLGETSNTVFDIADGDRTIYLLGAMGMGIPVGLGIASGSSEPVLVVEGDGGLLMNLGALVTAARYARPNLSIAVLENGSYASTGGQPTSLAGMGSLETIARGCGFAKVRTFVSESEIGEIVPWLSCDGPRVAFIRVKPWSAHRPLVPLEPHHIADRFIQSR